MSDFEINLAIEISTYVLTMVFLIKALSLQNKKNKASLKVYLSQTIFRFQNYGITIYNINTNLNLYGK